MNRACTEGEFSRMFSDNREFTQWQSAMTRNARVPEPDEVRAAYWAQKSQQEESQ